MSNINRGQSLDLDVSLIGRAEENMCFALPETHPVSLCRENCTNCVKSYKSSMFCSVFSFNLEMIIYLLS